MNDETTDLLRKLLDEHGVEWLNSDGDCCDSDDDYLLTEQYPRKTTWSVDIAGDDMTITAHEVYDNDELQPWFELEFHEYFTPEQAIAATLGNSRAERTCKLIRHGSLANMPSFICWSCSKCGFGWHHSENDRQFSFCPNCGARVVGE